MKDQTESCAPCKALRVLFSCDNSTQWRKTIDTGLASEMHRKAIREEGVLRCPNPLTRKCRINYIIWPICIRVKYWGRRYLRKPAIMLIVQAKNALFWSRSTQPQISRWKAECQFSKKLLFFQLLMAILILISPCVLVGILSCLPQPG